MSNMYKVCNDNDVIYTRDLNSLISTTSDSKQFSFCDSNIDCVMYSFLDKIIV